ncbi:MAG TPA: hypothetical protein VK714_12495 [Myxococcota bacterium]|nr:hypothetical protein [Myxococcota bacterium]
MNGWSILLFLLGTLDLMNALWMLIAPESWYANLPAGVPDTGPLNVHFVRDIGCAFLATGIGLVWAAVTSQVAVRFACVALAAVFVVGHGAVHLLDLSRGALDARHWLLDLPGVFVPALILVALTLHSAREAARPERRSP